MVPVFLISVGESNVSVEVSAKTLCGMSSPVVNAVVESSTTKRITFRWDPPVNYNGNISYEVNTIV